MFKFVCDVLCFISYTHPVIIIMYNVYSCTHMRGHNIDFILTYQDQERQEELIEGKTSPDHGESGEKSKASKKRSKRERFLESCRGLGLELELQECNVGIEC